MLGLVMETVTPGRAPPLESAARPVIVAVAVCANAAAGSISRASSPRQRTVFRTVDFDFIHPSPWKRGGFKTSSAESIAVCGERYFFVCERHALDTCFTCVLHIFNRIRPSFDVPAA